MIVGEDAGHIDTLAFYSISTDKLISELRGGTYGTITITMGSGVNDESFSNMLAPGYAFQYIDGGEFLEYTKTATNKDNTICRVEVVECVVHVTKDSGTNCIYCNTALTETDFPIEVTANGVTTRYAAADMQKALDAAAGGTAKLLANVTLTEGVAVECDDIAGITRDLNGKTLSVTNERLAAAGYFSILNYYESLHLCG